MTIERAVEIWYKYTYCKGKFETLSERASKTKAAMTEFFTREDVNFVSVKSKDFIRFLEERIGPVEFTKHISMKLKPKLMLFIDSKIVR